MLVEVLAWIGAVALTALVITALALMVHCIRNVIKVANDYEDAGEASRYQNTLLYLVTEVKTLRERLYKAEREASNARYRIDSHVTDNKHTKTAKALKRDKERKQLEKEEGHRNAGSWGDGM